MVQSDHPLRRLSIHQECRRTPAPSPTPPALFKTIFVLESCVRSRNLRGEAAQAALAHGIRMVCVRALTTSMILSRRNWQGFGVVVFRVGALQGFRAVSLQGLALCLVRRRTLVVSSVLFQSSH